MWISTRAVKASQQRSGVGPVDGVTDPGARCPYLYSGHRTRLLAFELLCFVVCEEGRGRSTLKPLRPAQYSTSDFRLSQRNSRCTCHYNIYWTNNINFYKNNISWNTFTQQRYQSTPPRKCFSKTGQAHLCRPITL